MTFDGTIYPPPGMAFAPDAQLTGPFDSAEVNPDGSVTLRGLRMPPFVGAEVTRWGNGNPYYAACTDCGGSIHWLDAPTGGWWAHDRHPDDGHDAVPPRRTHDSRGECICQTIGNPPCHWCSTTCCAEHIDHCLAGFPVPCCERCSDVE